MKLTSKVSPEIEIEHVDESGRPEQFILRKGEYSYSVLPGTSSISVGDLDALKECAAPAATTNNTAVRIARIHDPVAARICGQASGGGWLTRLYAVASNSNAIKVGSYYDHITYGTAGALDNENDSTPFFVGVFDDVTTDFLAAATPDQLSAREEIGTVWQRVCIDAEPTSSWHDWSRDRIVFAGNVAPDLSVFNARERLGLLVEAGFRDIVDFETRQWKVYNQTADEAARLTSFGVNPLPAQSFETLSYFRLHSDQVVQREVYAEMVGDAVMAMRQVDPPAFTPALALSRKISMMA
jgi:hypothetical protein